MCLARPRRRLRAKWGRESPNSRRLSGGPTLLPQSKCVRQPEQGARSRRSPIKKVSEHARPGARTGELTGWLATRARLASWTVMGPKSRTSGPPAVRDRLAGAAAVEPGGRQRSLRWLAALVQKDERRLSLRVACGSRAVVFGSPSLGESGIAAARRGPRMRDAAERARRLLV
jgi:hypothetical protein